MPNISFKILVDGWGRAVKQEQQLDIINKFDFLGLQVQPASCSVSPAVLAKNND